MQASDVSAHAAPGVFQVWYRSMSERGADQIHGLEARGPPVERGAALSAPGHSQLVVRQLQGSGCLLGAGAEGGRQRGPLQQTPGKSSCCTG